MNLRRGDLVTVASGGGFAGKPRPALVIQDDTFAELSAVVLLLFTRHEGGHPLLRPVFVPNEANGLRESSRLMIHALQTVRVSEIGKRIGMLTPAEMAEVDAKLLLLLGFAGRSRP